MKHNTVKPPLVDTLRSDGAFFAGFEPLRSGHSLKWTPPIVDTFFQSLSYKIPLYNGH